MITPIQCEALKALTLAVVTYERMLAEVLEREAARVALTDYLIEVKEDRHVN